MNLASFIRKSFGAMDVRVNPAVFQPGWVESFRNDIAMAHAGESMSAAEEFMRGVETGWPAQDVQSSFLTACVIIERNVRRLRSAGIFSMGTQSSAQAVLKQMREKARAVMQEQKDAVARLRKGVEVASANADYDEFVMLAKGNLAAIARFVDQTIEVKLGVDEYRKTVESAPELE